MESLKQGQLFFQLDGAPLVAKLVVYVGNRKLREGQEMRYHFSQKATVTHGEKWQPLLSLPFILSSWMVGPCCGNTWGGNAVVIGYYETIRKHLIICYIKSRKIPIVPDSSQSLQNWYMKYLITTVIQAEVIANAAMVLPCCFLPSFPNCVPSSTKFTPRWP